MMVVDASAILAIALDEPDASVFAEALARTSGGLITAVNYWEVLVRLQLTRGASAVEQADTILGNGRTAVASIDAQLAREAAAAFARYRGRPARLNLGDCFAYALAMREGDGLLFKGDDFPRTDVASALAK